MKRDDNNLSKLQNGDRFTGDLRDFNYMFDLDHAVESLKLACPHMPVFRSMEHLNTSVGPPSADILYIEPIQFAGAKVHGGIIADPDQWRGTFETWLNATVPYTSSPEWKAWIDISTPLLDFPQNYQPQVSRSLGRIIRFTEHTRRLAATVYYELCQRFDFHIDPATTGIPNNTYFGAHLRTASDATAEQWPGYDLQVPFYLQLASAASLSVIYTSSDNPADVARFTTQAWETHQINVTSKADLLQGEDLTTLNSLSWDQQALVDYEVLLKASQFSGITQSTFTTNLAVRRHVLSKVEDCYGAEGWWKDEFSLVYGQTDAYRRFFEGMWA